MVSQFDKHSPVDRVSFGIEVADETISRLTEIIENYGPRDPLFKTMVKIYFGMSALGDDTEDA